MINKSRTIHYILQPVSFSAVFGNEGCGFLSSVRLSVVVLGNTLNDFPVKFICFSDTTAINPLMLGLILLGMS
ncbi:hypothetical protein SAMN05880574_103135 [Chryseobacterium sp. RU37D]|nr:hypothetical protein SAMN05880574_103135 [Chryseobacterium sp. RU37D]